MIDATDLAQLSRDELKELQAALRKALAHKRPLTEKAAQKALAGLEYGLMVIASSLQPLTTHETDEKVWRRVYAKLEAVQPDRIQETARTHVRRTRARRKTSDE